MQLVIQKGYAIANRRKYQKIKNVNDQTNDLS